MSLERNMEKMAKFFARVVVFFDKKNFFFLLLCNKFVLGKTTLYECV